MATKHDATQPYITCYIPNALSSELCGNKLFSVQTKWVYDTLMQLTHLPDPSDTTNKSLESTLVITKLSVNQRSTL